MRAILIMLLIAMSAPVFADAYGITDVYEVQQQKERMAAECYGVGC